MQLQAHRGVCTEYPENTMAAFLGAVYQDYKIIELDPNVTADGKFVILHDNTINRTARKLDGSPIDEPRKITEMTYHEAAGYDYGVWFSPKFKGEKIPLLEDVLKMAGENGILLKIDNKIWNFPEKFMDTFWQLLRDSKTAIGITSKNLETTKIAVRELPDAEIHYDGEVTEETLEELRKLCGRITVWLPFSSKLTSRVKLPFASDELCRLVKQYAKLGIWIISRYEDFDEVMDRFDPDVVETPGQIKPVKNQGCLVDMHTHSEHSHDSVCHIQDIARAQHEKGMYGFAVTDHCDIHKWKYENVTQNIHDSVMEVEKLQKEKAPGNIRLLSGVEIGEGIWAQQVMETVLRQCDYDVVIGSVHTIQYKQYDNPYSRIPFSKFTPEEIHEYIDQYLDDVLCTIDVVPCDILPHLFCPLRYIHGKYGFAIDCKIFEDKVRTILHKIITKGISLEINTSCMSKDDKDWLEQDWLLGIYKEMGGLLVTLGSDAHGTEHAAREFEQAVSLLRKYGFRNCFYYEKRRSIQCTIALDQISGAPTIAVQ